MNLPGSRLEGKFQDFKPALKDSEAVTEANRCIDCYSAPCISACPTEINIPQFIARIAADNALGAARTILNSNVLGLSCASSCPTEVLCEGACVYHALNKKPIMIGRLQRYAVEKAYDSNASFFQAGAPTGKKVALIGAGPASLACAHELRRQGVEAVILEKSKIPGGLNTSGIAPYKMKAETSLREIQEVEKLGVQFKYGEELGQSFQLSDLLPKFDAVFLGLGLGPDSQLKIPGADSRVHGAVDFIAKMKLLPASELAPLADVPCALVVGGGNTALDAVRELKKLGIARVVLSYRRGEAEMSGYFHETNWAKQEGVEFKFHTLPTEMQEGCVTLSATEISKDGSVNVTPTSEKIPATLVLVATGQSKLEALFKSVPDLRFEKGKLSVTSEGRTSHSKIYAGGDLANGGKEVVNAVAEGKRAAKAICQDLLGKSHG
jgi:glutamate synthase (NADPH/NADH) small chain